MSRACRPPPGLLAEPLKTRRLPSDDLPAVHRRRILPTVVTQTPQRVLHRRLLAPVLRGGEAQPPAAILAAVRTRGWPRSPADASGQVLPMLLLAPESPARTLGDHIRCLGLCQRNFLQTPFQPCDPE